MSNQSSQHVIILWWTNIAMENHHFKWENPLFLWPFSIAMLVHQRVYSKILQDIENKHFWRTGDLLKGRVATGRSGVQQETQRHVDSFVAKFETLHSHDGSMYGIYGNIYHQYTPNVSIYTNGSYGVNDSRRWIKSLNIVYNINPI